jgi:hypothetical protein
VSQKNFGNETTELFERSLVIDTKNYGPDGSETATANFNMGTFYYQLAEEQQDHQRKIEYLRLSETKHKESFRINSKIFGLDNPQTIESASTISMISNMLSKA